MVYKLNGLNCGGCRRVSDEEKKYAFEVSGLGRIWESMFWGKFFIVLYAMFY